MPDLFLSRGVYFLDKGDMQSAKKEFLAGLDEASGLPYSEGQQEALIAVITTSQLQNRGLVILKRRCPGSGLRKKNRINLVELYFPKSLLLARSLSQSQQAFGSRLLVQCLAFENGETARKRATKLMLTEASQGDLAIYTCLTLPGGVWMDRQQALAELEWRTLQCRAVPSLALHRL